MQMPIRIIKHTITTKHYKILNTVPPAATTTLHKNYAWDSISKLSNASYAQSSTQKPKESLCMHYQKMTPNSYETSLSNGG